MNVEFPKLGRKRTAAAFTANIECPECGGRDRVLVYTARPLIFICIGCSPSVRFAKRGVRL